MFRFITLVIMLFSGILSAQSPYKNIMVSDTLQPEEPSLAINPNNLDEIVAGANIYNRYYSNDGGETWQIDVLQSESYGVWGDPCVVIDTAGHYYYFHLSNPPKGYWIDRIVCQKSVDGGKTWTDGTYIHRDGKKAQDKEWATVDRQNNAIYVCWTEFDKYNSADTTDRSRILFSKSEDGGESWAKVKVISQREGNCLDNDNTVEGAVPAVGPNGEVYVAWAAFDSIFFDCSLDGGETWLNTDKAIATQPGGWKIRIPGIMRSNGLPVTVCDTSQSPWRGTIYVNWADQRNGEDDTDIWLSKSKDGGQTWSEPKRVNDDESHRHQFFSWIAVDPVTGHLYIVFYDRRSYNNHLTDVYLAISRDGGETFSNQRISQSPFKPDSSVFFGDYTNIVAYNNRIRPMWGRLDGKHLSLWTALIDLDTTTHDANGSQSINLHNPLYTDNTPRTLFAYKLRHPAKVSLKVYDLYGKLVAIILDEVEVPTGKYIYEFLPEKSNIPAGIYYFMLTTDQSRTISKLVYIKP